MALRGRLSALCQHHGIRGTILLASEGINGTIAGHAAAMEAVMAEIRAIPQLADIESKKSHAEEMPFLRMKVRLKKEIVTLGVPGVDPTTSVGRYVAPEDWNNLISEPDVLVIDTRNNFEVAEGTFEGAIDPGTRSFGEFPDFVRNTLGADKTRRIAMFCTGGIRCEKATSFMLDEGFTEVYHLKGGILNYLEKVKADRSLWKGRCFVFDERMSLGHGLSLLPGSVESND